MKHSLRCSATCRWRLIRRRSTPSRRQGSCEGARSIPGHVWAGQTKVLQ